MVAVSSAEEKQLMSKIGKNILPYIILLDIIAMIDRVNVGFTALTMNKELGISASAFGLIAGIFFITYFFFEVPSNVIMYKVGARKWITRILITWGLVVIFEGFIRSAFQLGFLRALLGIAEAGFYPAMILYITYWFPGKHQARAVSYLMLAVCGSNIIGGPISAFIMDHVTWFGISGWRWVYILEGLPAVVFGVITYFVMVDKPEDARFLTDKEKEWLINELENERIAKEKKVHSQASAWSVLKVPRVWHMGICYMAYVMALYGVGFWMPQMIKELSKVLSTTQVGLLSSIPYIVASVVMLLVAHHSDKTKERRFHVAFPILMTFIGLIALTMTSNLTLSMVLLTIALSGVYAFGGTFWTIPNLTLCAANAAVGIALINSVGNLGGFVGPYFVGWLKDFTGSTNAGMYMLAGCALLETFLILVIPKNLVTPPGLEKSKH
ncbi:MAG TPA: MFS transporter [Syntrophomonadaceae bacterium]|nr:MFS transporter [Syntrophomonadaceae bacterium]